MATASQRVRMSAEDRREQILGIAAVAFGERGFRGVALADIATEAGLSEPGLLHHFGSKQDLLFAVLKQREQHDAELVDRIFSDEDATLLEALLRLCEHNRSDPVIVRLFAVTSAEALEIDHPAHELFQARYDMVRTRLTQRVEDSKSQGVLPKCLSAPKVAAEITAIMDGLQLQWLLDPSTDMCTILAGYLERLRDHTCGDTGALGPVDGGATS